MRGVPRERAAISWAPGRSMETFRRLQERRMMWVRSLAQ